MFNYIKEKQYNIIMSIVELTKLKLSKEEYERRKTLIIGWLKKLDEELSKDTFSKKVNGIKNEALAKRNYLGSYEFTGSFTLFSYSLINISKDYPLLTDLTFDEIYQMLTIHSNYFYPNHLEFSVPVTQNKVLEGSHLVLTLDKSYNGINDLRMNINIMYPRKEECLII